MRYTAFGLTIESEFVFPELGPSTKLPDVWVYETAVPEVLDEAISVSGIIQVTPSEVLFNIPLTARYMVSNGSEISFERFPGVPDESIRLYLLGMCFATLIHQRNLLPIHGSCVVFKEQAVIFCGQSKAGKSTTASIFMQKGYPLMCDDISVISLDNHSAPVVYPGFPQMKLWEDSFQKLLPEKTTKRMLKQGLSKWGIDIGHRFFNEPLLLLAVFVLQPHDEDTLEILPISGFKKFEAISRNTFRFNLLQGLSKMQTHFDLATVVVRDVPFFLIKRPLHSFKIEPLFEAIEQTLNTLKRE